MSPSSGGAADRRGERRLRRIPVLLPHLIERDGRLFAGRIPLPELRPESLAFCRACDGSATLSEVLEHHEWSDELDEVLDYLVWLDRPLRPSPEESDDESHTVVLSPRPEVGLASLAGWLLQRRGRHRFTHLVVCDRLRGRDDDPAFPSLIGSTAIRRDEADLAARALGCHTATLGFSELALRREEFTGEKFERRERCVRRSLRLALHAALSTLRPDRVFAPAAIGDHPDHRFLFDAALDLFKENCFPDARFHLYEELPLAADHLGVDDFLSRFEKAYVDVEPGFEDISDVLEQKGEILRIFRSCFDPSSAELALRVARRNVIVARRWLGEAAATGVERYWTLRELAPGQEGGTRWT